MKEIYGFFSNKYFVKGKNGKRLTPKSEYSYYIYHYNNLTIVEQSANDSYLIRVFKRESEELIYKGVVTKYAMLFNKFLVLYNQSDKGTSTIIDSDYNLSFIPAEIITPDSRAELVIAKFYDKYGYINEKLQIEIEPQFISAHPFNSYGYAVVKKEDNLNSVIDKKGNVILSVPENIDMFLNENYIITICQKTGCGLINIKGERILSNFYSNISFLNDNYIKIEKNNKYGIADFSGNILLEPIYDEIMETENKFVVRDFSKIEIKKTIGVNK